MSNFEIRHGDSMEILPTLAENSVDSVCCDPPYHLQSITKRFANSPRSEKTERYAAGPFGRHAAGFMGQSWDGGDIAMNPETWGAVLRVLKPGGHLVAFGGTRTHHRIWCAIEDAGFEVRDTIMWVYGCLDEETQLVTPNGVEPYHSAVVGDLVLCYDAPSGAYSYQPILEVVVYEYDDTAYRIIGDFGEQIVSRNHRCIVERDGNEVFQLAEKTARQRTARVPILEDLPALQEALRDTYQRTGGSQQGVRSRLCGGNDRCRERRYETPGDAQREDANDVRSLWRGVLPKYQASPASGDPRLLETVQRKNSGRGMEDARAQGPRGVDAGIRARPEDKVHGPDQSRMEGRPDLPQSQGVLCDATHQVRSLSGRIPQHGSPGWVCDGAPAFGCQSDRASFVAPRSRPSHEPQRNRQRAHESDVVCNERGAQGIRAWRGHRSAVVRIVPFRYVGKVWCLRVPTGAFVAVRGGVAFPTGNSGFPKSHGAGDGWGTALKPAFEPIILARKPLSEKTVAANMAKWGTGALNIDGCRVPVDPEADASQIRTMQRGQRTEDTSGQVWGLSKNGADAPQVVHLEGRWPANLILSWREDEYEIRGNVTADERRELYRWLSENA